MKTGMNKLCASMGSIVNNSGFGARRGICPHWRTFASQVLPRHKSAQLAAAQRVLELSRFNAGLIYYY
jgi:hypothetical protein